MDPRMISVRRVFNLGNYENISVEIQAMVDPGEAPKEVLTKLSNEAEEWHKGQFAPKGQKPLSY